MSLSSDLRDKAVRKASTAVPFYIYSIPFILFCSLGHVIKRVSRTTMTTGGSGVKGGHKKMGENLSRGGEA